MQEYTSKQVQIRKPAAMVYRVFADFTNFTPIAADRVDDWQATPDECSFRVKGFTVALQIVEREENRLVKFSGSIPFPFTLWLQLHEVSPNDTRLRLVLHAELNTMMKMMIGKKLAQSIDQAADTIAQMFNEL
jgi:carbon monoxide dehydrogenase subunit G